METDEMIEMIQGIMCAFCDDCSPSSREDCDKCAMRITTDNAIGKVKNRTAECGK